MKPDEGQTVSSNILNINFRTNENTTQTLELLKSFQNGIKYKGLLQQEIINENGAPYLMIKTNLCERPLKFLIDTGASISLIAKDLTEENTLKKNCCINLYGLVGKEICVRTEGIIHTVLSIGNQFLDMTFHVIERKYAGPGDGYLGFDFLSLYKTEINLEKMNIQIKLEDVVQPSEINGENESFLFKILAESYEFEEPKKIIKTRRNKREYKDYFETNRHYLNEFEKRNGMKIHNVQHDFGTKEENIYSMNSSRGNHFQEIKVESLQ